MAGGCIDIYTSRRTEHEKCYYWKRNEDNRDLSEYAYEEYYDGFFYAREYVAEFFQKQNVSNTFMFDSSTITLETKDKVEIEPNDVIFYDENYWRVVNVNKVEYHKNSQFGKKKSYQTFIQIKR